MAFKKKNFSGFSLIEVLAIVGVLCLLALMSLVAFYRFHKEADFSSSFSVLFNTLKLAQNKTVASEGDSRWGIYLDNLSSPNQYILFKGSGFVTRDHAFDQLYKLPHNVIFSEISLGGSQEVVFKKITGATEQEGKISLCLRDDPSRTKAIYLDKTGQIWQATSSVSDAGRFRDSRHVHLIYTRTVDSLTESIILTFEGGVEQIIPIVSNMLGGQIFWQGEVEVLGERQLIRIITHRLNDAVEGTVFSIIRDRRWNNKALDVDISGDPNYGVGSTGSLIKYEADGTTLMGSSSFVSEPLWQ